MESPTHLIPAKEHDRNESRLHKEGQNSFYSQRCPKDIAHKPRIITPVCAKLKFENQSSGHTDGKINTE